MRRSRLEHYGFSTVELLITVGLLSLVVLALAASSMYTSRAMARARVQLQSVEFLQGEIERLRSIPYDSLTAGARTTAMGSAEWTVQDSAGYSKIMLRVHYNPTEGASVRDSTVLYRRAP